MKIIDMLPQLDTAALATVHANAVRLVSGGTDKQRAEAGAALPLIEAEQAKRASEAPPKATRAKAKAPAKPKAKAKTAAKARAEEVEDEEQEEEMVEELH